MRFHTELMADRKRITATLKALEWLQNLEEDDSGAESDVESDTDVCNLNKTIVIIQRVNLHLLMNR